MWVGLTTVAAPILEVKNHNTNANNKKKGKRSFKRIF